MDEQINSSESSSSGSKMGLIIGAIVLLVVAAGGYYFWSSQMTKPETSTTPAAMEDEESDEPAQTMDMAPSATAPTGTESATAVMEDGSQTITVEGGNFYFKPNEIRVKAGTPVKLTLSNVQGFHDIVIDEFDVKSTQITAGNTITVEFTPTQKGSFEYYCSVGQHRQMGMKGTLIVE